MKKLTIGGKEYTIEFTIEASLYDECVERTVGLMQRLFASADSEDFEQIIHAMTDIPKTTLVMLYAGLLENHSDEVKSLDDAKELIKTLIRENKEDELLSNFYGIMQMLMEVMQDDGFFKQIGLEQMMTEIENETQPEKKATPKKATTTKVGEK